MPVIGEEGAVDPDGLPLTENDEGYGSSVCRLHAGSGGPYAFPWSRTTRRQVMQLIIARESKR